MEDAYVRIEVSGDIVAGPPPTRSRSLLFVDAAEGTDITDLRKVPHEYLSAVREVVIRNGTDDPTSAEEVLSSLGTRARVHTLRHTFGAPPRLTSSPDVPTGSDSLDIIQRCRSAEIGALISLAEAYCCPEKFHFQLPSGRHSTAFLRFGSAIRTVRDARSLASWLLEYCTPEVSIALDSSTLLPVALALESAALGQGEKLGPVYVLPGYPYTQFDISRAIRTSSGASPDLLSIISVSSTGTLADTVMRAASELSRRFRSVSVATVVDMQGDLGMTELGDGKQRISLYCMPESERARFKSYESECPLCADAERATTVPVDPRSFDALFPTLIRPETPSVVQAEKSREFWEVCDAAEAIQYQAAPDDHVLRYRPARMPLSIKFDLNALLASEGFVSAASRAVANGIQEEKDPHLWTNFDVVLVPEDELKRPGFGSFWALFRDVIKTSVEPLGVAADGILSEDAHTRLGKAKNILIFSLGVVTGTSMQHVLTLVQASQKRFDYELSGLVIHARPERMRAWQTLKNSFGKRLLAGWVTPLPSRGPLEWEGLVLDEISDADLPDGCKEFTAGRKMLCQGRGDGTHGVLWGSSPADRISPHSIFGERLKVGTIFAAAASVVYSRIEENRQRPEKLVFEMPAIASSYYDPMILASFIRWIPADRMWWGKSPSNSEHVVSAVLERALREDDKRILFPELLLAVAQKKIPTRGAECVIARADAWRREAPAAVRSVLDVGIHLARRYPNT